MLTLVVSSGGSKGAWAGGVIDKMNRDWELLIGSSTGSLMIPFIAAGDIKGLRKCYTNINSNDIYTYNPFNVINSTNGIFKYKINHLNIIKNFISGNTKTLGSTTKLRELISKNFTQNHYDEIRSKNKNCVVCVTNLSMNTLETHSIVDNNYDDFCDWIWASTCAPPFMSIVHKNSYDYVDSALLRSVPIREAILLGAREIDAIVLNPKKQVERIEKVRNVLHFIHMIGRTMFYKNMYTDIDLYQLINYVEFKKTVTLNIYYTQRELTNNPVLFDKEVMEKWWDEESNNVDLDIFKITSKKVKKLH